MENWRDAFDFEHASLKDVRALGGEVIEVPFKSGLASPQMVEWLGLDLAQFVSSYTGRGYDLSRETMMNANTRFVREPGHESYGLRLYFEGNRVVVSRVAILEDEMILGNYLKHLKSLTAAEKPKPKVFIDVPDDFGTPAPEPDKDKREEGG